MHDRIKKDVGLVSMIAQHKKNVSGHYFFDYMMCCIEKGAGSNFQRR